jgi:cell division protein FtsI (penicillin-binding protein 3)
VNWGPIDPGWGEGWEDFDIDPFADEPRGSSRRSGATVTRLPRPRRGRHGDALDRSITAPRPSAPRRATPRPRAAGNRTSARSMPAMPATPRPLPRRPRVGVSTARAGRPERRSLLLKVVLGLLLVAVVAKLVDIQVLRSDRLVAVGEDQRLRTVRLEATRGRILDREGRDLALSVLRPSIFADPGQIDDPVATARALAPVVGIDVGELIDDLSRDTRFVYLAQRIEDDLAAEVVALGLEGIHLSEEPARFTPSDDLARSIIGTVADDQTGSTGIELLYDDVLTGTAGELRYERARDGGTIAAAGESRTPARPGSDVVLTLDRSLQYEAERLMAAQVDALDAKGGIVVVSRPGTGEILALANITRTEKDDIITAGANRAVIDVFEPGSVNKVITMAAALEEGLVEPDTSMVVPWRLPVADYTFSDHEPHPTEPMTVTEILAKSSNVGTIMIGQQLGKDRIDHYLRSFGFGQSTALGFPNESRGLLLDPERWSGTSIGSIPLGQGIAVTAVQMLGAYNVIANDGVYTEPRLVDATVAADGTRTPVRSAAQRRVVSMETARQVRSMLATAVEDGTGARAKVPGYTVGGKTGTARKPQANGTYRDEDGNFQYVAAFAGMVPAEAPELTILAVVDEPSSTIYGGSAAAPVFADLARFALNRFRIPPAAPTAQLPTTGLAAPAAELAAATDG